LSLLCALGLIEAFRALTDLRRAFHQQLNPSALNRLMVVQCTWHI